MNLPNLPLYQSMKKVRAGKITVIIGIGSVKTCLLLELPDGSETSVDVDKAWMDRHTPQVGGYFVIYPDSDNYTSFSPCDPFEEGHRLIPELKPATPTQFNEFTRDLPDRRVTEDRRNVVIRATALEDTLANLPSFDLGQPVHIGVDLAEGTKIPGAKFPENPFPGVNIDKAHVTEE